MKLNPQRRRGQAGFSLIELMLVLLILTIVMGVVFNDISNVQKRYRTEEQKLDLTQESREFLDQIVRDLRQAGFPNSRVYDFGAIPSPMDNDVRVAAGLVRISSTDIVFEGDIDQDGQVDSVRYALVPGTGGRCPCTIGRIQTLKVTGSPMPSTLGGAQNTVPPYQVEVQNVINSNNSLVIAGTSVFGGTSVSNDTLYGDYKRAPIFEAFDRNGVGVDISTPQDITTAGGLNAIRRIKQIKVNMHVLAATPDIQTGLRPAVAMTATARLVN